MTTKFENGLFIFRRDLRIIDNNGLNLLNENCKNVASTTNGLSESQIARSFGVKYPNYQLRYDAYDICCNKIKSN